MLSRVLCSLSMGYILFYCSEWMFWSSWRSEDTLISVILTWLTYSIVTFVVLYLKSRFKVADLYSYMLLGAFYGWMIEGVIVQEVYKSFPFQLVFTSLSWHALFSVLLFMYFIPKTLNAEHIKAKIITLSLVGSGFGFWATYWRLERDFIVTTYDTFMYILIGTLLLMVAYNVYHSFEQENFQPTKSEWVVVIVVIGSFGLITVLSVFWSLFVLPPLLFITLYGLKRHSQDHRLNNVTSSNGIRFRQSIWLLVIPGSASLLYGLMGEVMLETNVIVALPTVVVALYVYIKSLWKVRYKRLKA